MSSHRLVRVVHQEKRKRSLKGGAIGGAYGGAYTPLPARAPLRHDILLASGLFGLAALFFRPKMAPRGF